MKTEEVIYVKLEYLEAFEGKKEVLSSEACLLRATRNLKKYNLLRKEELNLKIKLCQKLKDANLKINKIKQILPEIKIPKILERNKDDGEIRITKTIHKYENDDIESQLREIQDKLKQLSR